MNRKYLVAAALLIVAAAPVSAQSVTAGIEAWQRADYAGAVTIWRPLAEKGDADAQFNLGQAYRLGRGVQTNVAVAKMWFERAASQDHLDAETTLGLLLFEAGDQSGGLKWLKKAADRGEPRAQLVYGTALVNGDGVTQDPVLGYAMVSRSAAQGLGPAKQTLDQLEQILPIADRKRGGEIARELAKTAPAPSPALEQPAAKPVQTAAKSEKSAPKAVAKAPPSPTDKSAPKALAKAPPQTAEKPAPKEVAAKDAAEPDDKPPPKAVAAKTPAAKPSPKPAHAAAEATPASGNWRIQLGAFSQKGNAEALYKRVAGKDALAGRKPFYVAAGAVTRLQVGPFESKSAAESACRAVGGACFPVAVK
ncbi:MAG TPA: SPOR domain-containing protein [Sphingomicrobium sp.]|jgi:hypothetical protein